jgi:hypothetical protein
MKPGSRAIVVMKLPEYEVPLLVSRARAIVRAMTDSSWFPSPVPSLASVEAAIDELDQAEVATHTRAVETVAVRDAKLRELKILLQQLCAHVQAAADANPENAASIIEGAAMYVKDARGPEPRTFTAKPGPVQGTVILVAPQAGNRAAYEWAYSTDGGETWTMLPVTVQANTTVSGLTPGSTVLFRYRVSTKDGVGDWSETVRIIVT